MINGLLLYKIGISANSQEALSRMQLIVYDHWTIIYKTGISVPGMYSNVHTIVYILFSL